MSQSSLLSWLKKPDTVRQPQSATSVRRDDGKASHQAVGETSQSTTREPHVQTAAGTAPEATAFARKESLREAGNDHDSLPANVEFRACTQKDIASLKRLTSLLLQIPYSDSFFREIINDPVTSNITLLAFWHDEPETARPESGRLIGAARCRLLNHALSPPSSASVMKLPVAGTMTTTGPSKQTGAGNEGAMLYLSTLVLLSPYRHFGIATRLLEILTRKAFDEYGITSVGAHVWEANDEGLAWYKKRGFKQIAVEKDYYRRLNPSGAVVMQKRVSALDLLPSKACRKP